MKVYYLIISVLVMWSSPAATQFFYSSFSPVATHYNRIFPQPIVPTIYHQHHSILPFIPTIIPEAQIPASQHRSSVSYNLPPIQHNVKSAEFKGFGYRTNFNDGASSTVFFVTGAEGNLLQNLPKIKINDNKNDNINSKARNLASNSIDIKEVSDITQSIQNILQPNEFKNLFQSENTVFNYYTYPADTAPLVLTSSRNSPADTTPSVRISLSNLNVEENVTETTTASITTTTEVSVTTTALEATTLRDEDEVAESRREDTQVLPKESESDLIESSSSTITTESPEISENATTESSTFKATENSTESLENEITTLSESNK